MASLIYNSALYDLLTGALHLNADSANTFRCMLVTSSYVPDKDNHKKRSDVTNETSGTGYVAGGPEANLSVFEDDPDDQINVTLGAIELDAVSITARGAVYYHETGNALTDNLVAYIDFGTDVTATAGTFSLSASTIRLQN